MPEFQCWRNSNCKRWWFGRCGATCLVVASRTALLQNELFLQGLTASVISLCGLHSWAGLPYSCYASIKMHFISVFVYFCLSSHACFNYGGRYSTRKVPNYCFVCLSIVLPLLRCKWLFEKNCKHIAYQEHQLLHNVLIVLLMKQIHIQFKSYSYPFIVFIKPYSRCLETVVCRRWGPIFIATYRIPRYI